MFTTRKGPGEVLSNTLGSVIYGQAKRAVCNLRRITENVLVKNDITGEFALNPELESSL
jgi:hypothetical protein